MMKNAATILVIPGRTEGANPESRNGARACIWIPGSRAISAFTRVFDALRRVPRNDG
jgi:hypothetical protein